MQNTNLQIDWSAEVPDPTLIQFVSKFQENRNKEVPTFEELLKAEDFEGIRKLAHNWKGFSRPYGYLALEAMGKALGEAAKSQNLKECKEIFDQFRHYLTEKEKRIHS